MSMSMIMQYVRVRAGELARLRELLADDPDAAYDYVDALADGDETADDADEALDPTVARGLDTDKAWDAMGFLLGRAAGVSVDVVHGGTVLTRHEWGYGPPRYLSPDEVATAARELAATPFHRLAEQFAPDAMGEVYPSIWDEAGALAYVEHWYDTLRAFLAGAAAEHDGVVVYLS